MRNYVPLLVAALATLAGCQCESYYCDDTGCYYCDGLGCRPVEPPPRPTCRGDYECSTGEICTDVGCIAECSVDTDCAEGYRCESGLCVEPTEPVPVPNPGDCTTDEQCEDGLLCVDGYCQLCTAEGCICESDTGCDDGLSCVDGTCTNPNACTDSTQCDEGFICQDGSCTPGLPPTCDMTGVCPSGLFCISGECRDMEDTCQFNNECAAGQSCVNGGCVSPCDNETCAVTGQTCSSDGFCVTVPPITDGCMRDEQCGAGRICIDTVCYDECSLDSECGEGRYCNDGRCRPDDRPDRCGNDSECRFTCVDGVCRVPCEDTMECAMVAVEFALCQENFCATTNEVTSNCMTSTDCSGGQSCIDGVCN